MAHYSQLLTQTLGFDVMDGPAPGPRAVWGCAYRLYRRHAASGH